MPFPKLCSSNDLKYQKVVPPEGAPIRRGGDANLGVYILDFGSHLGCSGQNTIIFSHKGLFRVAHDESYKNNYTFVCVLKWSLLGVKKRLGHVQIGLLRNFR